MANETGSRFAETMRNLFSFEMYKRSQARLMRTLTAAGLGLIFGWGLWALHNELLAKKPDWQAKHLFSLRSDFATELDNQTIPTALQEAFQDKGLPLSQETDDVRVLVQEPGSQWRIRDQGRGAKFELVMTNGEIRVSSSGISAAACAAIAYGVPGTLALVAAWGVFRLYNWPRFADFLIATEAEMSKVSWSSKEELKRATAVVLLTMFLLAGFLLSVDMVWSWFLEQIGVLRPPEQALWDNATQLAVWNYPTIRGS